MGSKRSVALIGPGAGPKLQIGTKGVLRVRGLLEDENALWIMYPFESQNEDVVLGITEDGDHTFDRCSFGRVVYEGRNKNFIAQAIMGDPNAIPGS